MKLTDTTKTVGSIIAVMLIPLGVIAWNFYSGQNQTEDNQDLSLPEINEMTEESNEDSTVDGIDEVSANANPDTQTSDEKSTSNENSKPGDAIGGVKTLPNTSKNPTPDE